MCQLTRSPPPRPERLMALRTNNYAGLTLERVAAGADVRRGRPLPEFVNLVLYHGDGPWRGPEHVTELFERSDPGRFRLVSWRGGEGADRPPDDITALVLGLAPPPFAGGHGRAGRGPRGEGGGARGPETRCAGVGEGGNDATIEGLRGKTESGRSEDDGRDGGEVPARSGRAGREGCQAGSPRGVAGRVPRRVAVRVPRRVAVRVPARVGPWF